VCVDQALFACARCPAVTVTLEAGGAGTYTARAIPGSEPGERGLGLVVLVAGLVLASGLAATLARVLPILITTAAVIAGLWVAGWVTRAVLIYLGRQQAPYHDMPGPTRPDHLTATDQADRELVTLRQAVEELHAQLAATRAGQPIEARHEHLHFHGLAAEQVAAVLAARQRARPDDGGEW
jgi:uncharacterized membrane protein YphA (DoxX/SURF4 family)